MPQSNRVSKRRVRFALAQPSTISRVGFANDHSTPPLPKANKNLLHPISPLHETDDSAVVHASSARSYRLRACSSRNVSKRPRRATSSEMNSKPIVTTSNVDSSTISYTTRQTSDVPETHPISPLSSTSSQFTSCDEDEDDADDDQEDNDSDYQDPNWINHDDGEDAENNNEDKDDGYQENQDNKNENENIPSESPNSAAEGDVETVVFRDAHLLQPIKQPKSFHIQLDQLRQTIILRWMRFYSYYPGGKNGADNSPKDLLRKRLKMPTRHDTLKQKLNRFLVSKFNQLSQMGLVTWDGRKMGFQYHPSTDVWLEATWDGFENSPCKPLRSQLASLASTKIFRKMPVQPAPQLDRKRRRAVEVIVPSSEQRPIKSGVTGTKTAKLESRCEEERTGRAVHISVPTRSLLPESLVYQNQHPSKSPDTMTFPPPPAPTAQGLLRELALLKKKRQVCAAMMQQSIDQLHHVTTTYEASLDQYKSLKTDVLKVLNTDQRLAEQVLDKNKKTRLQSMQSKKTSLESSLQALNADMARTHTNHRAYKLELKVLDAQIESWESRAGGRSYEDEVRALVEGFVDFETEGLTTGKGKEKERVTTIGTRETEMGERRRRIQGTGNGMEIGAGMAEAMELESEDEYEV